MLSTSYGLMSRREFHTDCYKGALYIFDCLTWDDCLLMRGSMQHDICCNKMTEKKVAKKDSVLSDNFILYYKRVIITNIIECLASQPHLKHVWNALRSRYIHNKNKDIYFLHHVKGRCFLICFRVNTPNLYLFYWNQIVI
jgi:hypothetical protein